MNCPPSDLPKGPGGVISCPMIEPLIKRAITYIDGQNLFHHSMAAFGHYWPNYDVTKLSNFVCNRLEFVQHGVRFYTGVPRRDRDAMWNAFWNNKLLQMRRSGILVVSRPLRYNTSKIVQDDGTEKFVETPQEKGIDIRLALDAVRMARQNHYDAAIIFSQDQDLTEAVSEIKEISRETNRWIKVVCAYPSGPHATATRGIDGADWHPITQVDYDTCLDLRDYRPARP